MRLRPSATASMASISLWNGWRLPLKQIRPGMPCLAAMSMDVAQLGLDAVVVRALVQAVGQGTVADHAGDDEVVATAPVCDHFLEVVAAAPELHRGVADLCAGAEEIVEAHVLEPEDRVADGLLDTHG